MSSSLQTDSRSRLPVALKAALTAFVAVLVPVYWQAYGPTNFLYFCDVALFLTLVAVWTEKSLPASMAAAGILIPQMLWAADYLGTLLDHPLVGMTGYMFCADDTTVLARLSSLVHGLFGDDPVARARVVSLFHGWLPFLLLYLVYRLGYDRRAVVAWTLVAWALMLVSYFFLPAPPAPIDNPNLPVNIDYVYAPNDAGPQTWMPPLAWLAFVMAAFPVVFFIPSHLLLRTFMPQAQRQLAGGQPVPAIYEAAQPAGSSQPA